MNEETRKRLQREVECEVRRELEGLTRDYGELELNGRRYIVLPIDTNFSGLGSKIIKMTIEKCEKGAGG